MANNIGSTDKIVRLVLAITIGYFAYSTNFETKWLQTILYVVSAILFITSMVGFCPLYTLFKINTCGLKK